MRKLIFKISNDGNISVSTQGMSGKGCGNYIELVRQFMNSELKEDVVYTESYYVDESVGIDNRDNQYNREVVI